MLTDKEKEILKDCMLPDRLDRLENVLQNRTTSLTVLLDRVHNYHNISAVLRSADAFGLAGIHLVGDEFEYNKNITQGTERWLEIFHHASPEGARDSLLKQGYSLVVLEPEEHAASKSLPNRSIPVSMLPFEKKLALVFGNEHEGVSASLAKAAEFHAFIPMHGFVESLNISVACAICLFSSTIAAAEPQRRTAFLSNEEKESLIQKWLKSGVRHSEAILREVRVRTRS